MSATSNNHNNHGWQKNDNGATFFFDPWQIEALCAPVSTLVISDANRVCTKLTIVPTLAHVRQESITNLPLGESYVRQNDFVAIYPEQTPLTFGFQVYNCVILPMKDVLVLELWLSVQTSTLESHPQLRIGFEADGNASSAFGSVELTPGQWQSSDGKSGLIVHPLDVGDCEWLAPMETDKQSDDGSSVAGNSGKPELLVFGGFMEKGVIRRMRLQLVHSRQKMDAQHWQHLVERFANSPLPLTA